MRDVASIKKKFVTQTEVYNQQVTQYLTFSNYLRTYNFLHLVLCGFSLFSVSKLWWSQNLLHIYKLNKKKN